MAIWRGVGGSGESTNDSTVPTVTELLVEAEAARDAAQLAETNAETAASTASTQASNASTSATNAASSATSAASSASSASSSATSAASSASTATTKASEAATSATNAANSATSAASSATTATTKASEASTSATNAASSATSAASSASTATTQATNAANSASAASTSATNAASSATSAATSATAAAASYDSFDDRYLGSKTSDPTLDNDGNALLTGALYWNSSSNTMFVYNGTVWIAAYLPSSSYMDLVSSQTAAGTKTFTSNMVLNTSTASDALRITQTGAGNALLVEDTTNPDSTPFVVDASGNVISGTTASVAFNYASAPRFEVVGTSQSSSAIATASFNGTAGAATSVLLGRGRGTVASPTTVVSGDDIGVIQFEAHDGTALIPAAKILAEVDGTPGTNDMPGRLVFSTTADGASSPTERVRITSGGDVGIGTSSPGQKLDVSGTARATTVQILNNGSSGSGATTPELYSPASATLAFGAGGAERMRIDSSGNLGLGVTPSAWRSSTKAIDISTYGAISQNSGGGGGVALYGNSYEDGVDTYKYKNTYYATLYRTYAGQHQWFYAPSGTAGNAITFTQAMTLDASGNLGIGTSSPNQKLEIASTSPRVRLTDTDGGYAHIEADNGNLFLVSDNGNTVANSTLKLGVDGSTMATIDSSGNLGLGVTPSAWGSGYRGVDLGSNSALYDFTSGTNVQSNLYCNGYVNSSSQEIYKTSAAASAYRQIQGSHRWYTAPSGTAGNAISFTQAMTLDASGQLGIAVTSPAAKLDVLGDIFARASTLRFKDSGNTTQYGAIYGDATSFHVNAGVNNLIFYSAGSERARIDSSGNFHTKDGAGNVKPDYGCRAWVNFNGTGTVAIRASGNVSSITDNGTGDYTVNFSTAMSDTNYCLTGSSYQTGNSGIQGVTGGTNYSFTTTSARFFTRTTTGAYDPDVVNVSVMR